MKKHYEEDEKGFPADAYQIKGWKGVAWHVLGWETEPDEDTEWSGYENRTGKVIAVMIGDDRHFSVDPDDITPVSEEDYCPECGQIGCHAIR
jgi:hypothetical protein